MAKNSYKCARCGKIIYDSSEGGQEYDDDGIRCCIECFGEEPSTPEPPQEEKRPVKPNSEMIDCPKCGHPHPLPGSQVIKSVFRCDNCGVMITVDVTYSYTAREVGA